MLRFFPNRICGRRKIGVSEGACSNAVVVRPRFRIPIQCCPAGRTKVKFHFSSAVCRASEGSTSTFEPNLRLLKISTIVHSAPGPALTRKAMANVHYFRLAGGNCPQRATLAASNPFHHPPPQSQSLLSWAHLAHVGLSIAKRSESLAYHLAPCIAPISFNSGVSIRPRSASRTNRSST